jgi:hypothetical protein
MPQHFGLRQIGRSMQHSGSDQFWVLLATGAICRLRLDLGCRMKCLGSEKNRLAELVVDQHCAVQVALAENRKRYPTREFA